MEHEEDSFAVEDFVCTPTDGGLPMSPPLPLLPSDMNNTDVAQSAQAVKLQGAFELPDITSTPTDVELLEDYLRPAIQRMRKEPYSGRRYITSPAVVNADLPSMAPWELPGEIARNNGMRHKYYLTDQFDLLFGAMIDIIRTPNGYWKSNTNDTRAIRAGYSKYLGARRTFNFHTGYSTKTNWIMNVYYSLDNNLFTTDGLVLCHVFKADSPDYNDSPNCPAFHQGQCNGNHCDQAFGAPSNASFNSTHPGSKPMHHDQDLLTPYLALFENVLLGDPDPDNSAGTGNHSATRGIPPMADHGHSKKRKKSSDVWDYFTKIFARDIDGNVLTFAVCNHCCKILTGNSKGGTTHLARHTCPCKFKPVAAGRNAKGSGGDVNVLSS